MINLKNETSNLIATMQDFKETVNTTPEAFCAVIILDLSKRNINRGGVYSFVVEGDDLESSISNFKESDQSSGLYDSDFCSEIMTVLFVNC